jgi:D-3-phosphoglycerate dehydrogenase
LTEKTRNIVDADAIARMKDGVRIINCARGGLVVEDDLAAAVKSGKVAGAGIDVFAAEPAETSPLFGLANVVCTPHLGAATSEAQENVAVQIAEQMSDYLVNGAVANALNMPSITAEEAPRLTPFVQLAGNLGSFAGQLTESTVLGVTVEYAGDVADMNTKALTAALLAGLLTPILTEVNMVNSPVVARERGMAVDEVRQTRRGAYETYVRLTVKTERQERSVAGTVFSDGKPRIIQIKGINLEAGFGQHMLYVTNRDRPGFIGRLGTLLGDEAVNIATFNLGRSGPGEDAIALIEVDEPVSDAVLARVGSLEDVVQAKRLGF